MHAQASLAEPLLRTAEHIDGNFRSTEVGEQVGKGMEHYCGDFELGCQLDYLSTGTSGNEFWSAFITSLDAGQDNERFVHPRHRVVVLLIDLGAPLGDGAAEAIDVRVAVPSSNA